MSDDKPEQDEGLETVNDYEDSEWEDSMNQPGFEPQPWGEE